MMELDEIRNRLKLAQEIEPCGLRYLGELTGASFSTLSRFMQFIQDGKLNEVEPVTCDVKVNTDSLIDAYEWRHELPREQK